MNRMRCPRCLSSITYTRQGRSVRWVDAHEGCDVEVLLGFMRIVRVSKKKIISWEPANADDVRKSFGGEKIMT